MHWGSGWGARFDAKGHGGADCSHPVKGFASGFATLDCLLPICCTATKASMTGHACLQSTSYFFPALTLLTFWVTFCVTFHLTNTVKSFCRRNDIIFDLPASVSEEMGRFCLQCGIPINKQPHRKSKRFCSDACRLRWWHAHRNLAKNATEYKCQNCGKVFRSVRLQKYCNRTCYFEARFGRKSYEHDLDRGAV